MFLALFFSLILSNVEAATCPDGWVHAGDECYRISREASTWYQAQEECWGQNGYLAEIKSEEQQKSLEGILPFDINFWIGLNDIANEGVFVWASSQPDNGKDEDCVHISGATKDQFGWNDLRCDR